MRYLTSAATAILLVSGCASNVAREAACGRIDAASTWAYCFSGPTSANEVLYYLHGGGGSERSWSDKDMYARSVEREWQAVGYPPPTVISISLGPLWLLKADQAREFVTRVIPALEARRGAAPRRRYLVGESMGGFNAIQLAMRHPSTFAKVAALCPGILTLSPAADQSDVTAFVARTGADRGRVEDSLRFWKSEFPDEETWTEVSPLIAGTRLLGPQTPPLYISCGTKDEFGFFEGAKSFAELAQASGAPTQWEPVPGGHCSVAPKSLARFFADSKP